jgi:hypothetical protein
MIEGCHIASGLALSVTLIGCPEAAPCSRVRGASVPMMATAMLTVTASTTCVMTASGHARPTRHRNHYDKRANSSRRADRLDLGCLSRASLRRQLTRRTLRLHKHPASTWRTSTIPISTSERRNVTIRSTIPEGVALRTCRDHRNTWRGQIAASRELRQRCVFGVVLQAR